MNNNSMLAIILVFVLVISLVSFLVFRDRNQSTNRDMDGNKCPQIYCPTTKKFYDLEEESGKEVLRNFMKYYFQSYLERTKDDWNYITPQEFYKIYTSDKMNDIFLLDVRKPSDYKKAHIPGSVNIFWLELMKPENLKKVPRDKEIIIVCYVGHTASQILVLMKLLGFRAKVLKFGMGLSPQKGVPVAGWTDYGYPVEKS